MSAATPRWTGCAPAWCNLMETRKLASCCSPWRPQAVAPHVSRDAALDWLCVSLAPGELPRSFAAGAQGEVAAAPARVVIAGAAGRAPAAAAAARQAACDLDRNAGVFPGAVPELSIEPRSTAAAGAKSPRKSVHLYIPVCNGEASPVCICWHREQNGASTAQQSNALVQPPLPAGPASFAAKPAAGAAGNTSDSSGGGGENAAPAPAGRSQRRWIEQYMQRSSDSEASASEVHRTPVAVPTTPQQSVGSSHESIYVNLLVPGLHSACGV